MIRERMTVADGRRMSEADRAGLAARSPEGHAAKSMHIRGKLFDRERERERDIEREIET